MKKLMIFVLVCLLVLPVWADGSRLVDNAQLLTEYEQLVLEERLDRASEQYDVDIVVVTVYGLGGKSARTFADDFFDYGGYGYDGVLLLVDMESRQWYISTTGSCIDAIKNTTVDQIGDAMLPELSAGDYAGAFDTFVSQCEYYLEYGDEAGQPSAASRFFVCLLVGFVIALIAVMVMKGQLKSVRQKNAGAYQKAGSLHLTQAYELFLYRNVHRTEKPKNNGSHTGSSGRSHGGGGGRF